MDETELKHEVTEFLAHYGVKGMKWGQRREAQRAANAKVQEAKATLKSAKAVRNEGRKSAALSFAKKAAVATAVVAGAAVAASIVSKSGGKPASSISGVSPTGRPLFSASGVSAKTGKKWLIETNSGEAFDMMTKELASRNR